MIKLLHMSIHIIYIKHKNNYIFNNLIHNRLDYFFAHHEDFLKIRQKMHAKKTKH